jgi:Icc protein
MDALGVLHLTDLHLVADPAGVVEGRVPADTLDAVTDVVLASMPAPDLVFVTGDIAEAAEPGAYERAVTAVATFGAPVIWLPGNHDRRDRMADALGFDGPVSDPQGPWRLFGLDSAWVGVEDGRIGERQLTWLRDELAEVAEPHVGVFLHHPPYGTAELSDAAQLLAALQADGRVRFVASGHAHRSFELQHDGIRFLGSPAALAGGCQFLWLHHDGRVDRQVADAP